MGSVKLDIDFTRFGLALLGSLGALALVGMGMPASAQTFESTMEFPTEPLPPSEQPPETVDGSPDEAIPPDNVAPESDFPASLVGGNVSTVVEQLKADGWVVVTRTPGLVQLDKGELGLDLGLDPANGEIVEAELLNI